MAMALVLGTVAVTGAAPAGAHGTTATAATVNKDKQQELKQITKDKRLEQQQIGKIREDVTRIVSAAAALPPEINSARQYAGPGSAPMLAASEAWDALSTELEATAKSYEAVVTGLATDAWSGPAASATNSAAAYISWLDSAAQQAETTAVQAQAAAAQFEKSAKGTPAK